MRVSKEELIAVLAQFNPWWRGEPIADLSGWRRAAWRELHQWVGNPPVHRAILVSGARQVGKTTLLLQQINALLEQGVSPANIIYATFDHPVLKLAGVDAVMEAWRCGLPPLALLGRTLMNQSATFATRDHATKRQGLQESTGAAPRPDIFDTLDLWLASPEHAYSSWVAGQKLKDSTKQIYIFMFGRFCQWLIAQGKRLDEVEAGDIRKFLDSANPNLPESRKNRTNSGRQRQQYVRQLEKVFSHLGTLGLGGIVNPGRMAGYERVGSGSDMTKIYICRY